MSKAQKETKIDETVKFDPSKYKRVKAITLPLLKQKDDVTCYIKIISEISVGKEVKQKKGETVMAPAQIMRVINLETGEEMEMIANAVLKSTFEENYPDKKYVNKCFAVTRHSKAQGKNYNTYSVEEIAAA